MSLHDGLRVLQHFVHTSTRMQAGVLTTTAGVMPTQ